MWWGIQDAKFKTFGKEFSDRLSEATSSLLLHYSRTSERIRGKARQAGGHWRVSSYSRFQNCVWSSNS